MNKELIKMMRSHVERELMNLDGLRIDEYDMDDIIGKIDEVVAEVIGGAANQIQEINEEERKEMGSVE